MFQRALSDETRKVGGYTYNSLHPMQPQVEELAELVTRKIEIIRLTPTAETPPVAASRS